MFKHTITIKEIKERIEKGVTTFMRKNNSPRGCECIDADEIKIGDEIIINNYFHTVIKED